MPGQQTPLWNNAELRMAVLQILAAAHKRKPGKGASVKMLIDILGSPIADLELLLWYLSEKSYIETDDRAFVITEKGLDFLRKYRDGHSPEN